MSAVENLLDATPEPPTSRDFRRDHHDRPLIVPAAGGKPIAYRRASGIGKVIDDTYNLEKWARRNVAFGMARDASLVARLLAIGGTPGEWGKPEKDEASAIVTAAEAVAQAHKGADIGTALHRLTEHLDLGDPVVAGPYEADLDAYRHTMDHWGLIVLPDLVECRMVCDDLQIAGTCDRIVAVTPDSPLREHLSLEDSEHLIADLKTGSVEYGGLSYAAQLAAYAHGDLYDVDHNVRARTPWINRRRGVIIHLPAGEGRCELHLVDLEAGYQACVLANQIHQTRRAARGWLEPATDLTPLPTNDDELATVLDASLQVAIDAVSTDLRARLNKAVAAGVRSIRWPAGVATFKQGGPATWDQVLDVERVVQAAETEAGSEFHQALPKDPCAPPPPAEPLPEPAARPERADRAVLERLAELHHALPVDLQQAAHGAVVAAGIVTDRRSWTPFDAKSVEEILTAAAAEHEIRKARLTAVFEDLDEDLAPALLRAVEVDLDDDTDGPVISGMTGLQADQIIGLAGALGAGALGAELNDQGDMVIVPVATTEPALLFAYESKSAVLAAAKDLAVLHGRPKPRSAAQVAIDSVLAALVLAGPYQQPQQPQGDQA